MQLAEALVQNLNQVTGPFPPNPIPEQAAGPAQTVLPEDEEVRKLSHKEVALGVPKL